MEDVEWVEDFGDQNAEGRTHGHVHLAFTEFHSLEVAQSSVANATRVGEGGTKFVVGERAVELNGDEFLKLSLPLEVDEVEGEADGQTFNRGVSFFGSLD